MKKQLRNYTNEELLAEIAQRGFQVSRKFPKPLCVKCFRCQKQFWIKWVVPQNNYSKKNDWSYWNDKENNKDLKICNFCLRNIYREDKEFYLENIKNIKKKRILSSYISNSFI